MDCGQTLSKPGVPRPGFARFRAALLPERAALEVPAGQVWKFYYYAGSQRVAVRTDNGDISTVNWIVGDHLGSTSVTAHLDGTWHTTTLYKPWGEVRYQSGSLPTDYTYTGQYSYQDDFGLMYYNARWYDPALGRFAQADSIIPGAGNPMAWDRYAYVFNSPLNYIDPSGHNIDCSPNDYNCQREVQKEEETAGTNKQFNPKNPGIILPPALEDFNDKVYEGEPPDVPGLDPELWEQEGNDFFHPDDPGYVWQPHKGEQNPQNGYGEDSHWNRRKENDHNDTLSFPENYKWGRKGQRSGPATGVDPKTGLYLTLAIAAGGLIQSWSNSINGTPSWGITKPNPLTWVTE